MDMNKAQVIEAAKTVIAEHKFPLHEVGEGIFFGIMDGREADQMQLALQCEDEPPSINTCVGLIFRIPAERLDAVSRFLHLVNFRLRLGSFQLNFESRKIMFRLPIVLTSGEDAKEHLAALIQTALQTADVWTPKIIGFAMSNQTAAAAAQKAFEPDSHPEWSTARGMKPELN